MKTRRKLLLTSLTVVLAGTLTAGTVMAFADPATEGREYTAKYDDIFEDFDRADIADTVTASASGVDIGEKAYLHVAYDALTSETSAADRVSQIYKHGTSSLGSITSNGTLTITMRAPEGGVDISDLYFAVRGVGNDNDSWVVAKSFAELYDGDGGLLSDTALTTEWQDYEISFTMSYEDTDVFPSSGTAVTATDIEGIHLYAADGASGVIDISSISYNKGGVQGVLNNFVGGDSMDATAKVTDGGFYWNGSTTGYIVKRAVTVSEGGSFTVVRSTPVGNYAYAVIEAEGDVGNLKIATTSDGTTWSGAAAYDGYSVNLTGSETGFKFLYEGTASVTVNRIFLTNLEEDKVAAAVPVIDGKTADILEDFNVSQSGFTGDYEAMVAAPQMEKAGLTYRLSYNNGDKAEVKFGNLVFDATGLGDGYINYKFLSKTAHYGDYMILKVKGEGGADLSGFRFSLATIDDMGRESWGGTVVWAKDMKASVGLPISGLDANNPYATEDGWYYIVINIAESGLDVYNTGYAGMDIYYSGVGKLYVNCIMFADEIAPISTGNEAAVEGISLNFTPSDAGYQYAGYMGALTGQAGNGYNVLVMDVTIEEGTDLSGVRFEFTDGSGFRFASENGAGSLYLIDGTLLADAGFVAGETKTVYIDLAKSGLDDISDFHVHTNGTDTGAFRMENLVLKEFVNLSDLSVLLDNESAITVKEDDGVDNKVVSFVPSDAGYQYVGYIGALTGQAGNGYNVLAMDITIEEGTDLSGVRFEFTDGSGLRFASENAAGSLYLIDGTLLADAGFVAGETKTVYIDLAKSGLDDISDFHIHTNGTDTGAFKIENITIIKNIAKAEVEAAYAEQRVALDQAAPAYDDDVKPEVSITTATAAKAGDEITIVYTASDDYSAVENLTVNVSVVKDGKAVALTNNKFTAEEGTYTVTVTVRDENGNEQSDTIQITVAAAPQTNPPSDGEHSEGGNLVWLWIVLGVVVVAAIGVGVYFILKKNKKS